MDISTINSYNRCIDTATQKTTNYAMHITVQQ